MSDCLLLKAGLWRSLASVWKLQLEKSSWWWLVFSSLLFFCSRKLQEQFVRRSLCATWTVSHVCRIGHDTEVCSLHGLCGRPFTCKGSTSDLVVLVTTNLKYCRCGMTNLPGPLSHIPHFRTARQPARSSLNQGRSALCAFCRCEMTVAPRNASCPLWVRARLKGVTSRCNEVCNVNFSSIW